MVATLKNSDPSHTGTDKILRKKDEFYTKQLLLSFQQFL